VPERGPQPNPGRVRLLIVDDHPVVRDGLRGILEGSPEFEVVGEAGNGAEAVTRARALRPDVVLMDLRMPDVDGVTAIKRLAELGVEARVLVLTTFDTDSDVVPAIEAGATGYLLKDSPRSELLRAVRAAARGEAVLSPSVATRLLGQVRAPAREPLSARELDVLALVARGTSNRDTAARLFISEATVKTHLLHIYAKLGVNDRAAAVAAGFERGLLPRAPSYAPGRQRYRHSRKPASSSTCPSVTGRPPGSDVLPSRIRPGPGPPSSGLMVRHSSSSRPPSASSASRCGPPSVSTRW
jgi:DNA-binding NarL/FixJ family response regulator